MKSDHQKRQDNLRRQQQDAQRRQQQDAQRRSEAARRQQEELRKRQQNQVNQNSIRAQDDLRNLMKDHKKKKDKKAREAEEAELMSKFRLPGDGNDAEEAQSEREKKRSDRLNDFLNRIRPLKIDSDEPEEE